MNLMLFKIGNLSHIFAISSIGIGSLSIIRILAYYYLFLNCALTFRRVYGQERRFEGEY
jgi:hypothetical protein